MRDDFRSDSDIDVLVEYRPVANTSYSDLMDMQDELEKLLGRKVDLADRRSVDRSGNYIRRKGILSGEPPVLRQMSYLLDMLLWARAIGKITGNNQPDMIDSDTLSFHALSFDLRQFVFSAGLIDLRTRNSLPGIPWEILDVASARFENDPFYREKLPIKEIAWEIVPEIIPHLIAVIPREEEI